MFILQQQLVTIEEADTYLTLQDRLAGIGAGVLKDTLGKMKEGGIMPVPQDDSLATLAPSLKKGDGIIAWDKNARGILNLIRGMNPWPGTFTQLGDKTLKIFAGSVLKNSKKDVPGTICHATSEGLEVVTGKDSLLITQLQLQGGKKMDVAAFLRGHKIEPGTSLK